MRNFKALSAILHGAWLIHPEWANAQMPLVTMMLDGKSINVPGRKKAYDDREESTGNEDKEAPVLCIQAGTFKAGRYASFDAAPAGSIALINLVGPVMKYDDGCGGTGSTTLTDMVKAADNSPNINSILIKVDSPGGMVDGTATLADAIKNANKPVVAFIDDGMMASAAYWIGSAADEIIASQKTDTIGSIGVYTTIADYTGYYEQMGIKLHTIYADKSIDKNKDYKDALAGDYTAVKADINFIADQFISVVKSNRKGKLNLSEGNPFTGKMFNALDAVKIGLIDSIGSFDQAVQRASELATPNIQKSQSLNNSNHTNMKILIMSAWGAVLSLFGMSVEAGKESVEKEMSAADWEKINSELAEKNTLVQKVKDLEAAAATSVSDNEAAIKVLNDAAETATAAHSKALSDAAATHETAITAANKQITDLTSDRDEWKTKAEAFGEQPGALGTTAKKNGTDKIEESTTQDDVVDMTADHNVEALRALGKAPQE